MTETILTAEAIKKPAIDEDDKIAIGQKLGAILRKYPSSRQLRDAQVPITLTVFEKLSKGSSKGNLIEVAGVVEGIDFTQNRVVLEGRRVKLGEIIRVSVPSQFEDEDEYGGDDFADEYDSPRNVSSWGRRTSTVDDAIFYEDYPDRAPFYGVDRSFPYTEEPFEDYWPDDVPDYDAEISVRQKEPSVSRRPKKTILYTARNGYRPPYAARHNAMIHGG